MTKVYIASQEEKIMSQALDILNSLDNLLFSQEIRGVDKISVNFKISFRKNVQESIAELEAMEAEIENLSSKCAEIAYDFENAVVEIEKLKTIIEEAIRKPMGVEPHSWSDYKMLKDNV